jgi:predicted transcriptional regulator
MQTKILLSIKPRFAEQIFLGIKRYEFRRVLFRSKSVTKVVVYASSPIQRVIGEFDVEAILALGAEQLWQKTKKHSGIEKSYFDEYFDGRCTAYAIKIGFPRRYRRPKRLEHVCNSERPPQSFQYLT